jgi:DNA-directed RNA polymerase subunit RPC12/RpoP
LAQHISLPFTVVRPGEAINIAEEPNEETKASSSKSKGQYKCERCGKSFAYPKDLKKHALVHSDLNPFRCKICSRSVRCQQHVFGLYSKSCNIFLSNVNTCVA